VVTIDLTNCDKEPVATIGHIQPHGMLLVADSETLVVNRASQNASEQIGRPIDESLGPKAAIGARMFVDSQSSYARMPTKDSDQVCIVHRAGRDLIFEIEPAKGDNPAFDLQTIQQVVGQVRDSESMEKLLLTTSTLVRKITGYDRVMAYRFDEEWNGEVMVDEKSDALPSWLHFRYPASDIPAPARELFTKNWSRLIPNAQFAPIPIIPLTDPQSPDAMNLTYSILRAPSPIHAEYLRNMKVQASFTLSLVTNERLWGMIACHHTKPYFVDYDSRIACELIAKAASTRLSQWEDEAIDDARQRLKLILSWVKDATESGADPITLLTENSNSLLYLVDAEGIAILHDAELIRLGVCPSTPEVKQLLSHVEDKAEPLFTSRDLRAMVLRLDDNLRLAWFRPEIVEDVIWGGNPHKAEMEPDGRIHPRHSFAAWKEQVRGKSKPWTRINETMAMEFASALRAAVANR
jgi:two-component system, chemotaxis family, sensor kinase Cph1